MLLCTSSDAPDPSACCRSRGSLNRTRCLQGGPRAAGGSWQGTQEASTGGQPGTGAAFGVQPAFTAQKGEWVARRKRSTSQPHRQPPFHVLAANMPLTAALPNTCGLPVVLCKQALGVCGVGIRGRAEGSRRCCQAGSSAGCGRLPSAASQALFDHGIGGGQRCQAVLCGDNGERVVHPQLHACRGGPAH